MKPEEYDAILTRLDKLERRDRWLRAERLLMLAVIAWLLGTGPVPARLLERVSAHVPAISAPRARVAAERSLGALRRALMANPVLDPQTVADDQREAFGAPSEVAVRSAAPATAAAAKPTLAPVTKAAAAQVAKVAASPAPTAAATPVVKVAATPVIKSKLVARTGGPLRPPRDVDGGLVRSPSRVESGSPAASASPAIAAQAASAPAHLPGPATQADGGAKGELPQIPEPASPLMLALAEWPVADGAASAARAASPAGGSLARLPSTIPSGLRAALTAPVAATTPPDVETPPATSAPSAPPASAPSASSTAAAPAVALKALGYSQSTDGSAQVVLSVGNALYVVNEGQEFLDRFRVVSVHPEGVDVEDRLSNQTIHLNFGP